MNVGFATIDISPPLPVALAGYACKRVAKQLRDPLFASLVVIEQDSIISVLCSFDVIAVDERMVEEVRVCLSKYGVSPSSIQLFATHTHSGPGGLCNVESSALLGTEIIFQKRNQEYLDYVVQQTEQAYLKAWKHRQDTHLRIAKGSITMVGKNRNDETLPGDESLFLMEFYHADGHKALLYHFACHPTVLNSESMVVSGDLPGAIRAELFDEYDTILFINGACGDISTRFTREHHQSSELERYAALVKEAIHKTLQVAIYDGEFTEFKIKTKHCTLRVKAPMSLEDATMTYHKYEDAYQKARLEEIDPKELRTLYSFVEGAQANLNYVLHHDHTPSYTLEVNVIQVQDECMITIPGELFSQLANPLKERYGCHFFGYANGYMMYIADAYAYEQHVYEAASSPFAKGQGEYLMSYVEELLKGEK